MYSYSPMGANDIIATGFNPLTRVRKFIFFLAAGCARTKNAFRQKQGRGIEAMSRILSFNSCSFFLPLPFLNQIKRFFKEL
jgi:hypothetical protein